MRALCRGVEPGDRRVFYCMNLPSRHPLSLTLMLPPITSRRSFRPDALQDGQRRGRNGRRYVPSAAPPPPPTLVYVLTLSALSCQPLSQPMGAESGTTSVSCATPPVPALTLTVSSRHLMICWSRASPKVPRSLRYLIVVPLVPCWVVSSPYTSVIRCHLHSERPRTP